MNEIVKQFGELLNDPSKKVLFDANINLFNAPTVIYIIIPKKELYIIYLTLVRLK